MRLLLNQAIKDSLYEYYGFDETQSQFRPMEFNTEQRYFELAAGVLDYQQEAFMQDNHRFFRPEQIDEVESFQPDLMQVIAVAERLRERTELVQWLPRIRELQIGQRDAHRIKLERANGVLEAPRDYSADTRPAGKSP